MPAALNTLRRVTISSRISLSNSSGVEVLPLDVYPQGNLLIGTEETAAAVKKSGVDAVIIGNAS